MCGGRQVRSLWYASFQYQYLLLRPFVVWIYVFLSKGVCGKGMGLAPVWLPGLPCRPSSRLPAAQQLLAYQLPYYPFPPSFFSGLNPTILGDHVSRAESARHPWPSTRYSVLSTQYSVLTKIQGEEIHRTVRPMDSRRFDTRLYFTALRIVRSIYASEVTKRPLPCVFHGSSVSTEKKSFSSLTSRVCRTQLS
jgi:hypothetical protein